MVVCGDVAKINFQNWDSMMATIDSYYSALREPKSLARVEFVWSVAKYRRL
jgi:hypothetical protein